MGTLARLRVERETIHTPHPYHVPRESRRCVHLSEPRRTPVYARAERPAPRPTGSRTPTRGGRGDHGGRGGRGNRDQRSRRGKPRPPLRRIPRTGPVKPPYGP